MRMLTSGDAPRHAGEKQFELEKWIDTAPFEKLLGMRICHAEGGQAELRMPFVVNLCQGGGLMHGGAIAALADTAVTMAIKSFLPEGIKFVTASLSLRYLAPMTEGELVARATITGPEGRTLWGKTALSTADGVAIAEFECVFKILRGQGYEDKKP